MSTPLYRQVGKVKDMTASGSYIFNRRRCIRCNTWRNLCHFAQDSRVCDVCAVEAAGGSGASAGSGATLPCLYSNNSIGGSSAPAPYRDFSKERQEDKAFSTSGRKSAFMLETNIKGFIETYGIDNCAFVTLTFPDHVTDPREASRRFNSLNSNFLRHQIDGYIGVYELHKSGRIHFHLIVNLGFDCRSGFDFQAVAGGKYFSVQPRLRALWKLWRERLPAYGFGRFQVVPIKGGVKGISAYVAKYVGKSLSEKKPEHKGFRLIRASLEKGRLWKVCRGGFSFISSGSSRWRECLKRWFYFYRDYWWDYFLRKGRILRYRMDESDYHEFLRDCFGSKWAFVNRSQILKFGDFETERPSAA